MPHAFEAVALTAVLVGASALAAYFVSESSISTIRSAVFVGESGSSAHLRSVAEEGWGFITDPGGFPSKLRALALFCLIVGAVTIALRAALSVTVLLLGPGVLAIVAAAANKYPLGGRYSLFLVPFLVLLVAAGAAEVIRVSRRPLLVGLPLIALLTAVPVWRALEQVVDPPSRGDVWLLLQLLDRQWRPGDAIYISRNAQMRSASTTSVAAAASRRCPSRCARRQPGRATGDSRRLWHQEAPSSSGRPPRARRRCFAARIVSRVGIASGCSSHTPGRSARG